jgi:hypothetical protein
LLPQEEQFEELQLPHELPPPLLGMWFSILRSSLARETNFDMARADMLLHRGQLASSWDFDIGRSCSNLVLHFGQLYSYIGISKPL